MANKFSKQPSNDNNFSLKMLSFEVNGPFYANQSTDVAKPVNDSLGEPLEKGISDVLLRQATICKKAGWL